MRFSEIVASILLIILVIIGAPLVLGVALTGFIIFVALGAFAAVFGGIIYTIALLFTAAEDWVEGRKKPNTRKKI